jgi:carbon dioxide concentrating mechanism protein CcmN
MGYFIGSNVEVSPDVAIAPSVILEATATSRLIIETGVCLGTGVIVQAYGGTLVLATGANLGKDVLIVGAGRVGSGACIGAESTLIDPHIDDSQVIAARSLIISSPVAASSETNLSTESLASSLSTGTVYGREQVMQLVRTLFPYRDALYPPASKS